MLDRTAKTLIAVLAAPLISAAAGPDTADLMVGRLDLAGSSGSTLSLGAVGLDLYTDSSYLPPRDDPYHFEIPSQRLPNKGSGIILTIPFGTGGGR